MFLGPLIQSARRYCEQHPQEAIPQSHDFSTLLAYSVNDNFEARSFDNTLTTTPNRINAWLKEYNAIAYVHISLKSHKMLSICSAYPQSMLNAHFKVEQIENKPMLHTIRGFSSSMTYPNINYFDISVNNNPFEEDNRASLTKEERLFASIA